MKRRTSYSPSLFSLLLLAASPTSSQAQKPGEVEIELESTPAAAPETPASPQIGSNVVSPAAMPTPAPAELEALRAEIAALSERVAASEAAQKAAEVRGDEQAREAAEASLSRDEQTLRERVARLGVTVSGYVQAQYGQNQLSEDELLQGGQPLNQDRFSIRRGRLRVKGRWKYVRADFELDASTTRGPTAGVRRASVSGVLPSKEEGALPLLVLTAGLTEIPIGNELQQGQDEILFLERTQGSLAFFPGPVDVGLRLDFAYGPLRAQLAVMNGVPLDDRAGGPSGVDPTRAPDYLGRFGVDTRPLDALRIAGGVSFLTGKGFHPGSDATKSVLQWDDTNADGAINAGELVAVAGRGALPSATFDRWAVGADLSFDLTTRLGLTRVYGELLLATNLSRGLYVADPVEAGDDLRELSWYAAFTQDLTRWGFVGFRYDVYDPNNDLIDTRRGQSVPADARIRTFSPVLGGRLPGYGRLTFEYDVVADKLARDTLGVPTDVANNQWTVRVQGEF